MTHRFLAIFAASLAASFAGTALAQPSGMPPALVVTAPVIERDVTEGQMFVGSIEPLQHAVIGSAVDGRVIELFKREGQRVEKGEAIAQLLTETIEQDLAAAEAELELRKAQHLELENGSRPEEVEQARARMAAAKSNGQYTASRRKRNEAVIKYNGTLSEDEYEQSIADDLAAQESLAEAKAAFDLVKAGPRKEKIAQAAAAVQQQEAVVKKLNDQIRKHTIVARFSGYVIAEHTEVGAWVKQGDPVAETVAIDRVDIVAQVNEQAIPFVKLNDEVRVEVPALGRTDLIGTVAAIVPQADLRARTFPVKIRLDNEIVDDVPVLKAGMYARAMLSTGAKTQATMVPKDAIVLGGPSPMVYVVTDESNAKTSSPRPVRLGVANGPWIQVVGDISAGQQVVVRGNERLQPRPQPLAIDSQLSEQQIDAQYSRKQARNG
jgi:multidrug efflux pump subunit AcrA (membrane-fusion protein)